MRTIPAGTLPEPLRVIIGAGEQRYDGWIATHKAQLDLLSPASFEAFFGSDLADGLLCEHVWEHLDLDESLVAAQTCFRFMRAGARLRVAVPDANFPDEEYQRTVQVGGPGPADHPAADHKVVYDVALLVSVFVRAGFDVEQLEWWDSSGEFHVRRWDPALGIVYRSSKFDHRNEAFRANGSVPGFTSLIVDAIKPS